ncbi:hypothetical protein Lfu02_70660 [Longispora fulva]|nr:hypothetical protein Lfu02_70660 [Longispora fulva]
MQQEQPEDPALHPPGAHVDGTTAHEDLDATQNPELHPARLAAGTDHAESPGRKPLRGVRG